MSTKDFTGMTEEPHVQPSEAGEGSKSTSRQPRGGFEGRSEDKNLERSEADSAAVRRGEKG